MTPRPLSEHFLLQPKELPDMEPKPPGAVDPLWTHVSSRQNWMKSHGTFNFLLSTEKIPMATLDSGFFLKGLKVQLQMQMDGSTSNSQQNCCKISNTIFCQALEIQYKGAYICLYKLIPTFNFKKKNSSIIFGSKD